MPLRRALGDVVGAIGLCGLALCAASPLWRTPAPPGPRAVATPLVQQVVGAPAGGKQVAAFRLENRGGRDLVVLDTRTTCGCSSVTIEPTTIAPGGSSSVRVEAEPPASGERLVRVTIVTNSEPEAEVVLSLNLIGRREPPFVVASSGPVRFGEMATVPGPEAAWVETRELAGSHPWVQRLTCSVPGVSAERTNLAEVLIPGGVVARRYSIEVRLAELPGRGAFREVVTFHEGSQPGPPIFELPVLGQALPPVYASPKLLYASFDAGTIPGALNVMLIARAGSNVKALPILDGDEPFVLDEESRAGSHIRYRVRFRRALKDSFETTPRFDVEGDRPTRLSVPLTLRALR